MGGGGGADQKGGRVVCTVKKQRDQDEILLYGWQHKFDEEKKR